MKSKTYPLLLLSVGTLLCTPFAVRSAPLPFGDNPLTGTTVTAQPNLAGTVLEEVFTPYDFSEAGNTVRGLVQNRVVRSTLNGTLDFYWRIIPDTTSTGGINAFRMIWSDGIIQDANWRSDDLGNVAPDIARNFAFAPGGAVNFLFSGSSVGPSDSSRFFFVRTDATAYDRSGFYDLICAPLGCVSQQYATFAPVPEPSTLGLAALGAVGLSFPPFSNQWAQKISKTFWACYGWLFHGSLRC